MRERTSSERKDGGDRFEGVRVTHPDKVLFPDQGLTKTDLIEHYRTVEEWILPHVSNRPLTLVRCPDGQGAQCFYQKHADDSMPDAIHTIDVQEKKKKKDTYMVVSDLAGLVGLVQMGVLEVHVWGSHRDEVDKPDRVIFDLDPGQGLGASDVADAARHLRERLDDLGLESFVMATGGKGAHVVVPLDRRHDFDEVREFSKAVAKAVEADDPDHYVAESSKVRRKGKMFVDYLRNARGATAICPYSTRAKKGAPVATPLRWDELSGFDPQAHDVHNIGARLSRLGSDPWEGYFDVRQSITKKARRKLDMGD